MRGETVCVGGIQTWRRERAVDAEIVLVLVDGLGHGLERLVILDVVGALDHRVILAGVIVDDLLVVDDAVPFSRVWQRERIAINGVGVGLAVIGEQFVRFGVLQWLAILLIFCELVETGDVEHGRRVGLGQLRAHGRIVCAGRTGLHVHLHTGFFGIHFGELLVLVHDFRLVVHEIHMALVGISAAAAAASRQRYAHGQRRGDRARFGDDSLLHCLSPSLDLLLFVGLADFRGSYLYVRRHCFRPPRYSWSQTVVSCGNRPSSVSSPDARMTSPCGSSAGRSLKLVMLAQPLERL